MVLEAIGKAGYKAGEDMFLALDVASSELWDNGPLRVQEVGRGRRGPPDQMVEMYADWVRQYPIISIEDGVAEGDWDGWKPLTQRARRQVQLVGDDVFVTNPEILRRGIAEGVGNSILVKLNQIGTVSETLDAIAMARARRLHHGHLPPLRRNRRQRPSPTSPSAPPPGRSRPARPAAATASPSTTSCCASKKNSARGAPLRRAAAVLTAAAPARGSRGIVP